MFFWPTVVAAVYAAAAVLTLVLEYASEMSKISRGMFTDTFEPLVFSELLTFPISTLHSVWHRYPDAFDAGVYRQHVRDAVWPTVINVAVEALLVAAIVAAIVRHRRRGNTKPD
jgi:hypothetical protein